jgi:putative transposase
VFDPSNPHPPGPRTNPRVRKIVHFQRRNTDPDALAALPPEFRGWHQRGYLPHRDEPGLIQFVTFRLTDSFPTAMQDSWRSLLDIESDRERRAALEAYLDQGHGVCWLQQQIIAEIAEKALRFFHRERYDLRAWVIMPNHIHALFGVNEIPMAKIVESWKKHIAIRANRELARRGPFWQADYWDTFMRESAHELQARIYIEENPVKARLVENPRDWPWSSARFRDESGKLSI